MENKIAGDDARDGENDGAIDLPVEVFSYSPIVMWITDGMRQNFNDRRWGLYDLLDEEVAYQMIYNNDSIGCTLQKKLTQQASNTQEKQNSVCIT